MPSTRNRTAVLLLAAAAATAAGPAAAQITLHAVKSPAGTVLRWTGGTAPYDAIRSNLSELAETAAVVDLGNATTIECASPDASTAGGNEDAAAPPAGEVFLYHVRGPNYGVSVGGKLLTPAPGTDCSSGGGRTLAEVCSRWKADYPEQSTDVWNGPTTGCGEGTVDPVAILDGVRRTNLYRWLVGLPPITENPAYSVKDQAAVVIERGLGMLNHSPQPGDPCYTADGAAGAGNSNLAAGYASLAASVDAYIGDNMVPSLGHRRWILYPPYVEGGFGFVEGGTYGYWSAQWVFGWGADPNPEYVAYPAAGPFPIAGLFGHWSLSVSGANFVAASVSVKRLSDGAPMAVSGVYVPTSGYGLNMLAWDVAGYAADLDYEITVSGVTAAPKSTYVYTTHLASCP